MGIFGLQECKQGRHIGRLPCKKPVPLNNFLHQYDDDEINK